MPCKHWNDDWIAHLYGELPASEERPLAAHLERCAECRAALDELRDTRELLREAAPEVPVAPRVLVLRPRPIRASAWAFAAGAACALLLFGLGFVAGPRWTAARDSTPATVARADDPSPATAAEEPGADAAPVSLEASPELYEDVQAIEQRLARLEARPGDEALSVAEFHEGLAELERRFNRERVRDLEYVVRSLTASELRTGTWMDQTENALTMLALRLDPNVNEQ